LRGRLGSAQKTDLAEPYKPSSSLSFSFGEERKERQESIHEMAKTIDGWILDPLFKQRIVHQSVFGMDSCEGDPPLRRGPWTAHLPPPFSLREGRP